MLLSKEKLDIPLWIKRKKQYWIACLRGIFDTDGCVIQHRYRAKRNWYIYPKLSFTSASPKLIKSIVELLTRLGMHARVTRNGREVRVESLSDVKRYFAVVKTNNPKHLKRYRE
jgi:intein/homing endonuclease